MTTACSPVARATAYLQKCQPAVQGEGGDLATYRMCCVLTNDFALSESQAWQLLQEWNRRCAPPWKESDLRVKLRSALRCSHPKRRGNKLDDARLPVRPPIPQKSTAGTSSGFSRGTPCQLKRLAAARPYGLEGLLWATERGLLVFGDWHGHEVYGATDASERVLEIRRVDGKPFPPFGDLSERKSHALRGSDKRWPVGVREARNFQTIALCEGIPDFLEAHYLSLWEQASRHDLRDVRCAPVVMLSAAPAISEDALPLFAGKIVRIFAHADDAGQRAGQKWARQLYGLAAKIELFNFFGLTRVNGEPAKDLYDLRDLSPTEYLNDETLWKLLP